jgi:3',5'-cyclic AMP phosphodiesterase CpdA
VTTKIAHISDLHFESRNASVADRLAEALRQESPDLIIATGDFANNPWNCKDSLAWVNEVCQRCGVDTEAGCPRFASVLWTLTWVSLTRPISSVGSRHALTSPRAISPNLVLVSPPALLTNRTSSAAAARTSRETSTGDFLITNQPVSDLEFVAPPRRPGHQWQFLARLPA